jgi:hypothetical protein
VNKLAVILLCGVLLLVAAGCPSVMAQNPTSGGASPQTHVTTEVKGFPNVEEGYGLYGATVTMDGVYPGYSNIDSDQPVYVTIVNGKDQARIFHLSLQQPGASIREGYKPFPAEYFGWIGIGDEEPGVAAGDIAKIPVTLSIPEDFPEELKGQSYEVRILVEDWSQTGFVQVALQEKWLITFAE